MRAHGTATRRFYNAFYHWTLLIDAPHSSRRTLATSTRQLATGYNHTSRPETRTPYRDSHLKRKLQRERSQSDVSPIPSNQIRQQPAGNDHDANALPSIIHGEVQGPQERPSSSLQPWEEVVRYKSFAGFSVEICIPDHVIKQMEEQGSVESLLNLPDLRIDVGGIVVNKDASGVGVPVRSVLCTGTVEDIEIVRTKFNRLRNRLAMLGDGEALEKQEKENNDVPVQQESVREEDPGGATMRPRERGNTFRLQPKQRGPNVEAEPQQVINGGSPVWRRTTQLVSDHPAVERIRRDRKSDNGKDFDARLDKRLQTIETFLAELREQRNGATSGQRSRRASSADPGDDRTRQQRATVLPDSQLQSHKGVGRSQAHDSHKTGASDESKTRPGSSNTDLEGHDGLFLQVEVEKRLGSDPDEAPFRLPEGFQAQLQEIRNRTMAEIKGDSSWLRFTGLRANIEEAAQAVQAIVDEQCDKISVPRRKLKEIIPLTRSAEVQPLRERRRQDTKSDILKMILRPLGHPVVLVIASTGTSTPSLSDIDQVRGVTLSSLTSVTMSPVPILSFNLRLPSRTWDAIKADRPICITLLESSAEGAAIAHAFTKPHEDPTEAFREVRRLGYILNNAGKYATNKLKKSLPDGSKDLDSAIIGSIIAKVKLDSCVEVGDHMIVVAEVLHTTMSGRAQERVLLGNAFGLTYANREFRLLGNAIKPMRIPEQDLLQTGKVSPVPDGSDHEDPAQNGDGIEHHELDELLDMNEVLSSVQKISTEDSHVIDEQTASPADEAIPPARDGLPVIQPLTTVDVEQMKQSLEQLEAADVADYDTTSTRNRPFSNSGPAQSSTTNTTSGRISSPTSRPSVNTPMDFLKRMWRGYSTSTKPTTSSEAHLEDSATTSPDHLSSKISDPSLLSLTAREFLNSHDDDPYVPRRMRAMMKAKKAAHDASKALERALTNGTLTAGESERLEDIITRNEQWLAKKLAFNSAYDLRLMLDKGKVDVRGAQWLESSIEKGMAVLLEEVRQVRALFESGKLDELKFKAAKEDLERDHLILATEAMRLRQMVDDEVEEVGVAPAAKTFDGFKGNV